MSYRYSLTPEPNEDAWFKEAVIPLAERKYKGAFTVMIYSEDDAQIHFDRMELLDVIDAMAMAQLMIADMLRNSKDEDSL